MPEFYDPVFYDCRVGPGGRKGDLYVPRAEELGGPVLELGCGTGDVLLKVAAAGHQVCGLDSSAAMLDRLREHLAGCTESVRGRVGLVQGSMEDFEFECRFRQIFIPNDTIDHVLGQPALLALFRRCHRYLMEGGRLVFDVPRFDVRMLGKHADGRKAVGV